MSTSNQSAAEAITYGPCLLVADLDGAMLGNQAAIRRFADSWLACSGMHRLVYASGRFYDSIIQSIGQHQLPEPDAIIGGIGTEIRLFPSGESLIEWQSRWWSSWVIELVQQVLDDQPSLKLQPAECQSQFKRSYFVYDAAPQWLQETRRKLKERQLGVELLYSENRDLDVVPSGASKGSATEFLARRWNIPRSRVIVAGDSANAISLFLFGYRGILAANSPPDLHGIGGSNVYRSRLSFADGIIDGLCFWLPDGFHSGEQYLSLLNESMAER